MDALSRCFGLLMVMIPFENHCTEITLTQCACVNPISL